MTYQAASGAGRRTCASCSRWANCTRREGAGDPASAILDMIGWRGSCAKSFPTEHFGVPSPAPAPDRGDLGNGRAARVEGHVETNKILARARPIAVAACVRVGAMRFHSRGLTIKLKRDIPIAETESILGSNPWVKVSESPRRDPGPHPSPSPEPSTFPSAGCASCAWAASISRRLPWATSCSGEPPSPCAGCPRSCSARRCPRQRRHSGQVQKRVEKYRT